ncbi:hypothetical protein BGZ79_005951, partial [Entomortierella chlamydospora]
PALMDPKEKRSLTKKVTDFASKIRNRAVQGDVDPKILLLVYTVYGTLEYRDIRDPVSSVVLCLMCKDYLRMVADSPNSASTKIFKSRNTPAPAPALVPALTPASVIPVQNSKIDSLGSEYALSTLPSGSIASSSRTPHQF